MRHLSELTVLALAIVLGCIFGMGYYQGRITTGPDPAAFRALISSHVDTLNLQGRLDGALQTLFTEMDKNKDGVITIDEFKGMSLGVYAAFKSFTSLPSLTLPDFPEIPDVRSTYEQWSGPRKYIMFLLLLQCLLFTVEHLRHFLGLGTHGFQFGPVEGVDKALTCEKVIALTYDTPLVGVYEITKLIIMVLSGMLFLRIIQGVVCFVLSVAAITVSVTVPNALWYKFWKAIGTFFGYGILFSIGFYRIGIHGKPATRQQSKLLCANHICLVELIVLFLETGMPSFVSRIENLSVPFFTGLVKATDSILVDRNDPQSREATLIEMKRRASDVDAPQLMVFPEGTCGNQRALFRFKRGPFEPGCPVQLVCFKLPYCHFNCSWTGQITGGCDLGDLIFRMCGQFVNRIEVNFLPVYTPSKEEMADPGLFSRHAMAMMATTLKIPISDATFDDYKECTKRFAAVQHKSQKMMKGGWTSKLVGGFWVPWASYGWVQGRAHLFLESMRNLTPRPKHLQEEKEKES